MPTPSAGCGPGGSTPTPKTSSQDRDFLTIACIQSPACGNHLGEMKTSKTTEAPKTPRKRKPSKLALKTNTRAGGTLFGTAGP